MSALPERAPAAVCPALEEPPLGNGAPSTHVDNVVFVPHGLRTSQAAGLCCSCEVEIPPGSTEMCLWLVLPSPAWSGNGSRVKFLAVSQRGNVWWLVLPITASRGSFSLNLKLFNNFSRQPRGCRDGAWLQREQKDMGARAGGWRSRTHPVFFLFAEEKLGAQTA